MTRIDLYFNTFDAITIFLPRSVKDPIFFIKFIFKFSIVFYNRFLYKSKNNIREKNLFYFCFYPIELLG